MIWCSNAAVTGATISSPDRLDDLPRPFPIFVGKLGEIQRLVEHLDKPRSRTSSLAP
jgi:hypothetical protein